MTKKIFIFFIPFVLSADISFNGFGTIGLSKTTQANNKANLYVDQEKNIDNGLNIRSGSILGFQATYTHDKFDIFSQAIFRENIDKEAYEPNLSLLFFRKEIAPSLSFSIGRLKMDNLFYSQSLYVDYSRAYAKLPTEVYSYIPRSNYDGIELNYKTNIGENVFNTTFSYSKHFEQNGLDTNSLDNNPINLELDYYKSFTISLEGDNFNAKTSYLNGRQSLDEVSTQLKTLATMAGLYDLWNENKIENVESNLYTAGIETYFDEFTFRSEYFQRDAKSKCIPNIKSYYLSLLYDIDNKFTPYIMYGKTHQKQKIFDEIENGQHPVIINYIQPLLTQRGLFRGQDNSIKTYTLGLKYNISDNKSLKFEIRNRKNETFSDNYNMFNLTLDFVF
jgi:opacity protein-like surface antigen